MTKFFVTKSFAIASSVTYSISKSAKTIITVYAANYCTVYTVQSKYWARVGLGVLAQADRRHGPETRQTDDTGQRPGRQMTRARDQADR